MPARASGTWVTNILCLLNPLRIVILGGPGEGKSTLAGRLARATPGRELVVANTSGHEGDLRHLVAAASAADLALVVVDARNGATAQTRRYTSLAYLLGIRRLVLVVNKMDVADHARFEEVRTAYAEFAHGIGFHEVAGCPVSALSGDNVTALVEHLERIDAHDRTPRDVSAGVEHADQFEATIAWMGDAPLLPGRDYLR